MTAVHPDLVRQMVAAPPVFDPAPPVRLPRRPFSRRELEVLGLLVQGLGNRQIARRLGLAELTIKSHLRHVFSLAECHTRAEMVGWVWRVGLFRWERDTLVVARGDLARAS